ncbi:uncharacterized protein TM35_000501190 [Trypanosoma theileri]|uniref:Mucin-associated surface protein (MASP) n=1 Tax=Trypanosoma theileri TaxID=67003 RepID=A0A1X0NH82_9TRYP|nr:uncharacterized protein TM35_000501190 [Trypanosoma theileri]ORC84065.1 hypothetical protein TM35_000501190 [Trypanosoma theileri]
MMMMMSRVMCVLAVVLCCACGYTMAAAATAVKAGQRKAVMAVFDTSVSRTAERLQNEQILRVECKTNLSAIKGKLNCTSVGITSDPSIPGTSVSLEQHAQQEHLQEKGVQGAELPEGGIQASGVVGNVGREGQHGPVGSENNSFGSGVHRESTTDTSNTSAQSTSAVISSVSPPANDSPSPNAPPENSRTSTASNNENTGNQQSPVEGSAEVISDPEGTSSTTPPRPENTTTESQETNSTTQPSSESNVTDAATTTPSPAPVPNSEISNIASTLKNKANGDSSVSPVWMRTAAPMLIVVVLFSATLY